MPPTCPGRRTRWRPVGLLMLRSYILSSDCAHYDAVIERVRGKRHSAAFPPSAGGLDGRPANRALFRGRPRRRARLAHRLQPRRRTRPTTTATRPSRPSLLSTCPTSPPSPSSSQTPRAMGRVRRGLGPVETTMLVALPEIDGATEPHRSSPDGMARRAARAVISAARQRAATAAMAPLPGTHREPCGEDAPPRPASSQGKRRQEGRASSSSAFRPIAGAVGTAAYLSVFEQPFQHLEADEGRRLRGGCARKASMRLRHRGPSSPGNAETYGQEANVADHVSSDTIGAHDAAAQGHRAGLGAGAGPQSSPTGAASSSSPALRQRFVGVQPVFGYEGDPMRLCSRRASRRPHAFVQNSTSGSGEYLLGRRHPSFRAARRARIHARQAVGPRRARLGPTGSSAKMPNVYPLPANNPLRGVDASPSAGRTR